MTKQRAVVLGITGGIGSGKSAVSQVLGDRGAVVLDADQSARQCFEDEAVRQALRARFGDSVFHPEGVDRQRIAEAVFADAAERRWLEALVHPWVRSRLEGALRKHLQDGEAAAIVLDVPLLLESSPLRKCCDILIFVDTPRDIRRQRVKEHRGWSEEELDRRERHQWQPEEKRKLADVVIPNDGSLTQLQQTTLQWLESAGGFDCLPRRAAELPPFSTIDSSDDSHLDSDSESHVPEEPPRSGPSAPQ